MNDQLHIITPAQGVTKEQVMEKSIPEGALSVEIIEDFSVFPKDRAFRDSWQMNAGTVEEDLVKSKAIHLDRLREARNKKLDELDKGEIKFLGQSKQQELNDLRTEKQRLRDLPVSIGVDSASSVGDLKKLWDVELELPDVYK